MDGWEWSAIELLEKKRSLGHRVGYHLFICASPLIMKNVGIAASDGFLQGSAIIVCRHSFIATHGPRLYRSSVWIVMFPGWTPARDRNWLSSGNSFNICYSAHIWTGTDQLRDHEALPNGFNQRTNNTKYAPSLLGSFGFVFCSPSHRHRVWVEGGT